MLKSTYSYPNQKNTSRACLLPPDTCSVSDMVKVNLFTKLDDCKVNKSKLIYDKCGKDLKCKIDDKTMNELKKCFKFEIDDKTKNELKENIKSELKKVLKFEIDDKTKNELKENIKSELEKGLKFEIGDKTKNELKEDIKSEIEKGLKFEIGDKTKNELKEDIKSEIEKGLKFEIGDETKNELKDEIKKEIIDEIDWCNVIDLCNDEGSKGTLESMLITEELKVNCPTYQPDSINKPAWFTRDLLKQFLPDLMSNKKITDHFGEKNIEQYHAENFAITFKCEENAKCGSNVNFTWYISSNMWCNKEGKQGNASALCNKDFLNDETSVCCSAGWLSSSYSKNFFLNNKCPNLILDLKGEELEECAGKTIVAKLESPLVILNSSGNIIDKHGNNTEIYYNQLKPYLNSDGTMKDCGDNADCQKYAKIIDKILWTSDKEVKLTITGTDKDTGDEGTSDGGTTTSDDGTTTSDDGTTTSNDLSYSKGMASPYHDYGNDLI